MNSISFYVPYISATTTADDITHAFREFGTVRRVDFKPLGKQPGFVEIMTNEKKSAFIHLANYSEKAYRVNIWIRGGETYKFYPYMGTNEYWVIRPAKSLIPDTMMNTAQIVENCRFLEKKVKAQEATLKEQEATIKDLQKQVENVQDVIYQIIGGIFCQASQAQIIDIHLSKLEQKNPTVGKYHDSKWGGWPTTRQGDDCELRIEALEQQIKDLTSFTTDVFEEISVSTHSSMPSLKEPFDDMSDTDSDF